MSRRFRVWLLISLWLLTGVFCTVQYVRMSKYTAADRVFQDKFDAAQQRVNHDMQRRRDFAAAHAGDYSPQTLQEESRLRQQVSGGIAEMQQISAARFGRRRPVWAMFLSQGMIWTILGTQWYWGWQNRRQRRRKARGLCVACGYDLRATPRRCPECGKEADGAAEV
ncbi:MAG TPA: hypothetical protein VFE47_14090 [Tepidisphaeraceae bacterium]|jgi:hypothetical protein|nr:hypothetical protein [Tepidisphaeraceae bacterium]